LRSREIIGAHDIAVYKDTQEHFDATFTARAAGASGGVAASLLPFVRAPAERSKISATQREPLPARARSGLPAKLPAFYEPTRCSKTAPDQVSLGGDIGDVSLVSFFWKMTRASQV
jgi:hypothetical protein